MCVGLYPTIDCRYYCIRPCSWVTAGDSNGEKVTAKEMGGISAQLSLCCVTGNGQTAP